MTAVVSFERDIVPMFAQFRASMLWRLDLTRYEHMQANAAMVYNQISTQGMPPPPYPTMTAAQIALFKAWMDQGYPR
jgi:hypothetical protein